MYFDRHVSVTFHTIIPPFPVTAVMMSCSVTIQATVATKRDLNNSCYESRKTS